ncbi:hypothetical protein EBS40_05650 [bacterium]|nr:hypothetical protein [bacterium]
MNTMEEFAKIAKNLTLYSDLHKAAREYYTYFENHPMADELRGEVTDFPLGHILDQLEGLD